MPKRSAASSMRSGRTRAAAAAALAVIACGCAPSVRPPGVDLTIDELLARCPALRPATLDGSGRVGVRSPDGDTSLSFRLAYDAKQGMRLDMTWKGLIGLVRREAVVLVRADSMWVQTSEEGTSDGLPLDPEMPFGLGAHDLVDLLLPGSAGPAARADTLSAFRALDEGRRYALTFRSGDRIETATVDAVRCDLLERVLVDRAEGRHVRVTYDRHAPVGDERRPFAIDLRDSRGPVRIRFVFSEQRTGRAQDPRLFVPPTGARLLVRGPDGATSRLGPGTFRTLRGTS